MASRLTLIALAVALVAAGCGDDADAPTGTAEGTEGAEPTNVTVGVAAGLQAGAFYWDVMVADSKGYFEENGVEPEFLDTKDGPGTVQAVTSGSAQIGVGATDAMISGIDAGADIALVAAGSYTDHALVVTSDIKSFEDLKGKKIASGALGAGSALLTTYMLTEAGLNPDEDVQFVLSGSTPERLAALKAGGASATLVAPPALQAALDSGFEVLQFANDAVRYVFISVGVNQEFASKNPEAVRGFVQAIEKAHVWLNDPANAQEAQQILQQYIETTPDGAKATYETDIEQLKIFPESAALTPELLQEVLGVMDKTDSDPASYIDTSYLG